MFELIARRKAGKVRRILQQEERKTQDQCDNLCPHVIMTRMSRPSENPITFHSLYDSPLLSMRDYRCRISCGGPGDEEQPDANQIVLMRYGAFRKHFGRRSVTADVNQAVFFSKQST